MKTKLVYVVTSSLDDIYWEEAWVSAWSARYHNPDAHIALVCDKETLDSARKSYRAKSLELFDETITVDFDPDISQKQRSRWLKTNLREYIRGDFLFIDSDTVITDSLNEIDDWNFDIGMVYDNHCRSISSYMEKCYEKAYKQVYPVDMPYYNSGVMFVKDNEKTNAFFHQWHQNWCGLGDIVEYTDQTPLARTVTEYGHLITEISGVYNCQISLSIKYLHQAKIIHSYHVWWHSYSTVSPFMQTTTYERIKEKQEIDEDLQQRILNSKTEFTEISVPYNAEIRLFLASTIVRFVLLPLFFKKRNFFQRADKVVHSICEMLYRLHIRV
jgi:hypothetical protein